MSTPTPEQIARNGAFAARLREQMARLGLKPVDLNRRLDKTETSRSGVYNWLAARGQPSPEALVKLSAALGVRPEVLTGDGDNRSLVRMPREPRDILPKPAPDTLQFNIQANGEARLRLDMTMPAEQAVPLLQFIVAHTGLAPQG